METIKIENENREAFNSQTLLKNRILLFLNSMGCKRVTEVHFV